MKNVRNTMIGGPAGAKETYTFPAVGDLPAVTVQASSLSEAQEEYRRATRAPAAPSKSATDEAAE